MIREYSSAWDLGPGFRLFLQMNGEGLGGHHYYSYPVVGVKILFLS